MKIPSIIRLLCRHSAALVLLVPCVWGQIATLRLQGDTATVSVDLAPNIVPTTKPVAGGVYAIQDNRWAEVAPLPAFPAPPANGSFPPYTRFTITFPSSQYNAKAKYKVVLFGSFKDSEDTPLAPSQEVDISFPLVLSLVSDPVTCPGGLTVLTKTELGRTFDWEPYYAWLAQFAQRPSEIAQLTLQKAGATTPTETRIERFHITEKTAAERTGNSRVCLLLARELPGTAFTATIKLNPLNLPREIVSQASSPELAGIFTVPFPKLEDAAEPEKRKLERNLDVGASLISSVADVQIPATATTPATIQRLRTTRGVFDIRFAPWLDVLHPLIKESQWLHFLTPFYANANVATGAITKETLGLNRVLLGLEGESRYYTARRFTDKDGRLRKSNPVWHRIKWGAQHASDRDFEQKEFTGKIEYAPIIESLYRPYGFNFYFDQAGIKIQRPYGFTFQPKMGFEIGRTYERRHPAPVIKPSAAVKRFYVGSEINMNLSQYFTFALADTFYVRGETPRDHYKNYFKGTIDFHFRVRNNLANGFFLAFERGQLPPFATPDVNSLRVGYRILGSFCREFCR